METLLETLGKQIKQNQVMDLNINGQEIRIFKDASGKTKFREVINNITNKSSASVNIGTKRERKTK